MITVGMATVPERSSTLEKVISSLSGQVDKIYLALNGFYIADEPWYPTFLDKYENVEYFWTDNSKGDAEKMHYAFIPDMIYLGCDDDLLYPKGYAQMMVDAVKKYKGAVSLHGKRYLPPITNFKKWAMAYRCLGTVSDNVRINLIGTGCCAFDTNQLKISLQDFKKPNMADVYFSKQCADQNVTMFVVAHQKGYLEYVPPPHNTTIWDTTRDYLEHVKVMRTFIK
jgi:hypothetical protein